jgi:hypothetical protein
MPKWSNFVQNLKNNLQFYTKLVLKRPNLVLSGSRAFKFKKSYILTHKLLSKSIPEHQFLIFTLKFLFFAQILKSILTQFLNIQISTFSDNYPHPGHPQKHHKLNPNQQQLNPSQIQTVKFNLWNILAQKYCFF